MRRGFIHQALALQDAETMLLVNRRTKASRAIHVVFNQRRACR